MINKQNAAKYVQKISVKQCTTTIHASCQTNDTSKGKISINYGQISALTIEGSSVCEIWRMWKNRHT